MASKELEIYSVVGCDLDYSTDDGDVCIYRLELRRYYCDVDEIEDGVYRFVDDWEDEQTGTMQELFELQEEGEEIFTMGDIDEEEYDIELDEFSLLSFNDSVNCGIFVLGIFSKTI